MPLNIMKEQSLTYTKTTFALFDLNLPFYGQLFLLVFLMRLLGYLKLKFKVLERAFLNDHLIISDYLNNIFHKTQVIFCFYRIKIKIFNNHL